MRGKKTTYTQTTYAVGRYPFKVELTNCPDLTLFCFLCWSYILTAYWVPLIKLDHHMCLCSSNVLSLVLSHRYFSPPAAAIRAHWRPQHQLRPHLQPSPAPPSLTSALTTPRTLLMASPHREERMGHRREEEPTPGPCSNPPSSASSCRRTLHLLPWWQRGDAPSSSLRTRRKAACIAKRWWLLPLAPPAFRSRWSTEVSPWWPDKPPSAKQMIDSTAAAAKLAPDPNHSSLITWSLNYLM